MLQAVVLDYIDSDKFLVDATVQLVSQTHRQALKLDAVRFSTSFWLEETTILAEVQQWAQPQPGNVTAQLQAVNV